MTLRWKTETIGEVKRDPKDLSILSYHDNQDNSQIAHGANKNSI